MRFGFVLPSGDARTAAELARAAEQAGWDAFFVWEPVWGIDAWVSLTAAAMLTSRIRLGTMLTPLTRMRPWKLASETATLDHLSGGRLILPVGLGAPSSGFSAFGEIEDRRQRAERLDEGLEILTRLWKGESFDFEGHHYQVHLNEKTFAMPRPPSPLQQPRIPIWVVGAWPSQKSLHRALRYDGLLPQILEDGKVRLSSATPAELRQITAYIQQHRTDPAPFDIVIEGETPGDDPALAADQVGRIAEAGANWWIESLWFHPEPEYVRRRLEQGPPRIT